MCRFSLKLLVHEPAVDRRGCWIHWEVELRCCELPDVQGTKLLLCSSSMGPKAAPPSFVMQPTESLVLPAGVLPDLVLVAIAAVSSWAQQPAMPRRQHF